MNTMALARRFCAHGDYSISIVNSECFVKASGAWNTEAKHEVHHEIISVVNGLKRPCWSLIVDITDFELGTPGFQQAGIDGKYKLIELGLQKVAYINKGNNVTGFHQIQSMQTSSNKYSWRLFDSIACAQKWLSKSEN